MLRCWKAAAVAVAVALATLAAAACLSVVEMRLPVVGLGLTLDATLLDGSLLVQASPMMGDDLPQASVALAPGFSAAADGWVEGLRSWSVAAPVALLLAMGAVASAILAAMPTSAEEEAALVAAAGGAAEAWDDEAMAALYATSRGRAQGAVRHERACGKRRCPARSGPAVGRRRRGGRMSGWC